MMTEAETMMMPRSNGSHAELPVAKSSTSPLTPRKSFGEGELEERAESIRERGLIQPVVVRPTSAFVITQDRKGPWRLYDQRHLRRDPLFPSDPAATVY